MEFPAPRVLRRDRASMWTATWALLACTAGAAQASAQTGQVRCTVTENGAPAQGTIEITRDEVEGAAGPCGKTFTLKPGKWKTTVRLDGVLDNPSAQRDIVVVVGKTVPVVADFETGVLEVRVEAKNEPGTGVLTVYRGSKRVGTLGAGVPARISAGKYEIVVRYGGKERRYRVDLRAGQRRLIRAEL